MLYTVGHGLLSGETLIANLSRHGIDLVVDVRSQPVSTRAPHFNRELLKRALEASGISYAWMGQALGGRPPSRLRTRAGAPDYERMAQEPATVSALDRLAGAAASRKIALLCSESRPELCHRTLMLEPQLEMRSA